jgi:hypothetical protein
MRRFAGLLAFALSVAGILVEDGGSATSKSSFQVFVEEATSAAPHGLTLVSELEGSFSVLGKTASGEGTYQVLGASTEFDHLGDAP